MGNTRKLHPIPPQGMNETVLAFKKEKPQQMLFDSKHKHASS